MVRFRWFTSSSSRYKVRSFVTGMGRAIDMPGAFPIILHLPPPKHGSVAAALGADMMAVGRDLHHVIKRERGQVEPR